ncbi:MAG: ATP-dependent DNA helicase RecG [Oleiphilaceae bacterium]|nr:ATP-dependent DNA helicase RecG [Oleiphilaceae bacterium]
MASLNEVPLTQLKGVGEKFALTLSKLDLHSVQDLIFHLPFRYEDRTCIVPLSQIRAGKHVLFEAEVKGSRVVIGRRKSLEVHVRDSSGQVALRFYHFSAAQAKQLSNGSRLRCYGEARLGQTGLEFYHPEYQVLKPGDKHSPPEKLTPIYTLTEGVQQPRLRKLCASALGYLDRHQVTELIPGSILKDLQLPSLQEAVRYLHAPPTDADQHALLEGEHPYQQRLIFEELLAHHLSLLQLRSSIQSKASPAFVATGESETIKNEFLNSLPFSLTGAQQRVSDEIAGDLSHPFPMLRLVQGDVGSGKTVVAALAALRAVSHGHQVAFMAPTEILAEQHYANFQSWLAPLGIKVGWLSGKVKGKKREQELITIADGSAQVVVGTHALFQDDVQFAELGLAIIDEQHRFGVHQRLALKNKGKQNTTPHQLIMTATPIPRTLAMSAYADLDTSVIDELPAGRQAIETFVLPDTRRQDILSRVQSICEEGRQAYWVCTLIEESEALQCQAAEASAAWLNEQLPELTVGLVHGRMKADEKSFMMEQFKSGKIDLLVATTVIEVGVDVPNASLIIIENPERLGLAQLHQLRGRVGRGEHKSYCALMYHPPLSQNGKERLSAMRESNDGFKIAEKDLEIRGPGEVLGTRQTGLVSFRIADIQRDGAWLDTVKQVAQIMQRYPRQSNALIERWVGNRQQFAEV